MGARHTNCGFTLYMIHCPGWWGNGWQMLKPNLPFLELMLDSSFISILFWEGQDRLGEEGI